MEKIIKGFVEGFLEKGAYELGRAAVPIKRYWDAEEKAKEELKESLKTIHSVEAP